MYSVHCTFVICLAVTVTVSCRNAEKICFRRLWVVRHRIKIALAAFGYLRFEANIFKGFIVIKKSLRERQVNATVPIIEFCNIIATRSAKIADRNISPRANTPFSIVLWGLSRVIVGESPLS